MIDELLDRARALKREYQGLVPVLRDNSGNLRHRLNFKAAGTASVPTLVPDGIMRPWLADDVDPVHCIEEIALPCLANGIEYARTFFESILARLKDRPIPGSRSGHEMDAAKRPPTDILLIGGMIEGDAVYLKNYLPPIGESGSNEILRREAGSGMLMFSLAAYCRETVDDFGHTTVYEAVSGLRNDVVEVPAMKQEVTVA